MLKKRWPLDYVFPAALALASSASSAQTAPVRLGYTVAEGLACPDASALRGATARRLGVDPFDDVARRAVDVAITRHRRGLRATLAWRGEATGARVIDTATLDCDALVNAASVSVAVMIDPSSVLRAPAVAPASVEPPVVAPPPSPAPPERPFVAQPSPAAPAGVAPSRTRGELRAQLGALVGLVPADDPLDLVRPWASLGAGLRAGRVSLTADVWAAWTGARSVSLDAGNGAQTVVTVGATPLGLSLAGCWRARPVDLCGVVQAGAYVAWGRGYPSARDAVAGWFGLGARASWTAPRVGPVEPYVSVEAVWLAARPNLTVTLSGAAWSAWAPPPVAVIAAVGLRVSRP